MAILSTQLWNHIVSSSASSLSTQLHASRQQKQQQLRLQHLQQLVRLEYLWHRHDAGETRMDHTTEALLKISQYPRKNSGAETMTIHMKRGEEEQSSQHFTCATQRKRSREDMLGHRSACSKHPSWSPVAMVEKWRQGTRWSACFADTQQGSALDVELSCSSSSLAIKLDLSEIIPYILKNRLDRFFRSFLLQVSTADHAGHVYDGVGSALWSVLPCLRCPPLQQRLGLIGHGGHLA